MTDETLIELALDGNDQALRELHDRYITQIFRYAYTQTGDYYRAEEVTQDIMYKMARNLADFKGDSSFRTWLFTISRRTIIDYYRKQKKHQNSVSMTDEQMAHIPEGKKSVEDQVISKDRSNALLERMQQLPVNDRTVLHLRYIEGLSIIETAKAMSKTTMAIKSLQTRAKAKLAKLLKSEVEWDETL